MVMHPSWETFGQVVTDETVLPPRAKALLSALREGITDARLVEVRFCLATNRAAIGIEVEVERPQRLAHPIARQEPIAIVVSPGELPPSILALREDFPADIPHQNDVPEGAPCALCIDDRPWSEAKLTWTAGDTIRRIQLWLAKAARGELHDTARPLDPLFFRSPISLVVPRSALAGDARADELVGFMHEGGHVIIARRLTDLGGYIPDKGHLLVMAFRVREQPMARLRHAPMTLARLAEEMAACGTDLIKELQSRTGALGKLDNESLRKLATRIALVVAFPITSSDGPPVDDYRAFVTTKTAGEIGVALGSLLPNTTGASKPTSYLPAIGGFQTAKLDGLDISPAELHFALDRKLAAATAGKPADEQRAVLIGAGSLGAQLAVALAREGCFSWTVVDNDNLLPHNLARHALLPDAVGLPKATALALNIAQILAEPVAPIIADIMTPENALREELASALGKADVIIDATASVAAARHISELPHPARRISAFFNPAGTAVVLLAEPKDRSITLRDLEAQYHRTIATDPQFAGHLAVDQAALRYSGSCRALTNRIPATQAMILSGLAAAGIRDAVTNDDGTIRIWTLAECGAVNHKVVAVHPAHRQQLKNWTIVYDRGLLADLASMREQHLPAETGGVLLGITDMSRRTVHVVAGLPQPVDSVGTSVGFERGVEGLLDKVNSVAEASLHQIRYVGEWHSHPPRTSARPSVTDIRQMMWLRSELAREGLPAIMAIAAEDGGYAFVIADAQSEAGLQS